MKQKTKFFKVLTQILAAIIIIVSIIFFSQKIQIPNENQDTFEEQQAIVSKDMRSALTENEKKNLTEEFKRIRADTEQFCGTITEINKSTELAKTQRNNVLHLENICKNLMTLSTEIKNEINYPAESADEKIAIVIGIASTLPELSQKIKNFNFENKELIKNADKLNMQAKILSDNTKLFKNNFLNAMKINITNPEPQLSEKDLTAIKALIARDGINSSEYDSKKFFENIKNAAKQSNN